jgi:hypothetical protein
MTGGASHRCAAKTLRESGLLPEDVIDLIPVKPPNVFDRSASLCYIPIYRFQSNSLEWESQDEA